MNVYNYEGRRDIVNGRDTSSKSSAGPVLRRSDYPSDFAYELAKMRAEQKARNKAFRKEHAFFLTRGGTLSRGEKLFSMADFPGKSPDDLKWPEAQGNDEGARIVRDDVRRSGGNPNETIAEYIERMNDPVRRLARFRAMLLSRKSSEDDGVPVRYTPPRSSKRAAYYDEDL